jgi:hypothetical protein
MRSIILFGLTLVGFWLWAFLIPFFFRAFIVGVQLLDKFCTTILGPAWDLGWKWAGL